MLRVVFIRKAIPRIWQYGNAHCYPLTAYYANRSDVAAQEAARAQVEPPLRPQKAITIQRDLLTALAGCVGAPDVRQA